MRCSAVTQRCAATVDDEGWMLAQGGIIIVARPVSLFFFLARWYSSIMSNINAVVTTTVVGFE